MDYKSIIKSYISEYMNKVFESMDSRGYAQDTYWYDSDFQRSSARTSFESSYAMYMVPGNELYEAMGDFDSIFDEVSAERNGWKGYVFGSQYGNANKKYLDYIEQYKDNPALYERLLENPHQDYSDLDYTFWSSAANSLGAQSKYDTQVQQRQADAITWADDIIKAYEKNEANSPASQSTQMRLAGQNPDLLGTDGVAEMGAGSPMERSSIPSMESPVPVMDIFSGILNTIEIFSGVALDSASAISQIGLQNAQRENIEVSTLKNSQDTLLQILLQGIDLEQFDADLNKAKLLRIGELGIEDSELSEEEIAKLENTLLETALVKADSGFDARFKGFSKENKERLKSIRQRLKTDSTFARSTLASWRRGFVADSTETAKLMSDPRYSVDIGIMTDGWREHSEYLKSMVDLQMQYNTQATQFQADYLKQLNEISPNLPPEEVANLQGAAMQAYHDKMALLNNATNNALSKASLAMFNNMMSQAEELHKGANSAWYERYIGFLYKMLIPVLRNFSMGTGAINLNGSVSMGFNSNVVQGHNTNHNFSNSYSNVNTNSTSHVYTQKVK